MRGKEPKLLSNVLQNMQIESHGGFRPGELVTAIFDDGGAVAIEAREPEGITCPMCGGDKGIRIPDGANVLWGCQELECQKRSASKPKMVITKPPQEKILRDAGVPLNLMHVSLKDSRQPRKIVDLLVEYTKKPTDIVLISGGNGTGKTYHAVCAIGSYSHFNGVGARFYNLSRLFVLWKEENEASGLKTLSSRLYNSPFLVLDDLGIRTPTEAFMDFLYTVINHRIDCMLGTLITTNLNREEIRDRFGEAISSRLFSGKGLQMIGKDKRLL